MIKIEKSTEGTDDADKITVKFGEKG